MSKILVTGATGQQGGAVVDHLTSGAYGEWEVYGLTRDADGAGARALAERGVTVLEGDLTDAERMAECCAGMDGVFLVTTFFEDGTAAERRQGETMATAAAEAGVDHLVFSSVGGADRDTGLAHFESKYGIERHIDGLGIDATIVRPVFFMQNFDRTPTDEIRAGRLPMPLAAGVTLQLVDADDIGRIAAAAFGDPERFVGEVIELAGDDRTLESMAGVFADHLGTDVEPIHVDVEDYRAEAGDEMADMFAWFNAVGYDADIEDLSARYGIDLTDLPAYLDASDHWHPAPAATR
ncbi:NmrA/HSCARG family protein [Haloplanus halophilus]|uniref:NmrA/HSCARG family protein n=1 Tax=Haloplanus halophilus TaxID=2949993 RepID=UPI0020421EC0|nr:NmrA/HSCARG family protein [Haloplanus sp. GDY1]